MPDLPVRPDLTQLRHQAKDLLRAVRRGEPEAIATLRAGHSEPVALADATLTDATLTDATLADAQRALARSYGAPSWTRLVQSCQLIDAIWRNDVEAVRALVTRNRRLLHENAGIRNGNWGPPLSYAANLGRDRIIAMLHALGARDLEHAIGRATLQGRMTLRARCTRC